MNIKALIEIDLPKSCSCCSLRFIHTDYNDNEKIGCGYLNTDVTEYSENRHNDCPLIIHEYVGYENYIRIGNKSVMG